MASLVDEIGRHAEVAVVYVVISTHFKWCGNFSTFLDISRLSFRHYLESCVAPMLNPSRKRHGATDNQVGRMRGKRVDASGGYCGAARAS
jgi:hypothetical protein